MRVNLRPVGGGGEGVYGGGTLPGYRMDRINPLHYNPVHSR